MIREHEIEHAADHWVGSSERKTCRWGYQGDFVIEAFVAGYKLGYGNKITDEIKDAVRKAVEQVLNEQGAKSEDHSTKS